VTTLSRSPSIVLVLWLAACGSAGEPSADHSHCEHHATPETSAPPVTEVPDGRSLQQLDGALSLRDQRGEPFALGALAGRPVLVTFFYGGCTTMCPLILSDVQRIVGTVPEESRRELEVVLVTIDPTHDTPERLRAIAEERGLPPGFHLVGGDESSIRTLASTLGMTYRALPDGSFAHAALYTVLDRGGVVAHQLEGTGRPLAEIVTAITRVTSHAPS
jgi:protein SCO1/2